MKVKTVFIAHPISGDVQGNLQKVREICKSIHDETTLPIFPSFTWRQYLDEEQVRELSQKVNEEYFSRGMVDELWLYGDTLSAGMEKEIILAKKYNIPIIIKNHLLKQFEHLFAS